MDFTQRAITITELGKANQAGRFTRAQMKLLNQVAEALDHEKDELAKQQSVHFNQLSSLRAVCPHPFRKVSWTEIIPAGSIKGYCDLCGELRWLKEQYPTWWEKRAFKHVKGVRGTYVELRFDK